MPFTQYTNLDFDQIKQSIKDYLRSNSKFTDFDFEGSNFSVLIDTLAYNTYISAFNANMIANESFLDSATMRENVVSLARNIGYVPRSKTAARATISFDVNFFGASSILTLKEGLVCIGTETETSYTFSIPEDITVNTTSLSGSNVDVTTERQAYFDEIEIYEGIFVQKNFTIDSSIKQRFILDNPNIDTSTVRVHVRESNEVGRGAEYRYVDNINKVDGTSEIFLLQEIKDEKYEIIFGDGYFGKKLNNNAVVMVSYIVTNGDAGNGVRSFSFTGRFEGANNLPITPTESTFVSTIQSSRNGTEVESLDSIKYFAPKQYSAQNRAVTTRDYETIVKQIYPNTESVAVVGGEELNPPKFGQVFISIKPKNGTFLSDFSKLQIQSKLKDYSIIGINQEVIDLKILYVEIDSSIYFNASKISTIQSLQGRVISSLESYAKSTDLNKFGGRFKYSKLCQVIDKVDDAITSNITKVRMRRDLKATINAFAQYELCFGNRFYINPFGGTIKSTGFTVEGQPGTVFLTDVPNKNEDGSLDGSGKGTISLIRFDTTSREALVVGQSVGTVDYTEGEVILNTIKITNTVQADNIIEIQAFPDSNDVIGLKDLFVVFDVSNSVPTINMKKDTISSGESISGVTFPTSSSYPNGKLTR